MKKLNRKGFTLIEILVVVAIIGILAGVVLVGLRGTGPAARDSRRASELKSVQQGLELFYNKNNRYPNSSEAANWTQLTSVLTGAGISISKVPNDPQYNATAGTPTYLYGTNAAGDNYVLGATLEVAGSALLSSDVDNPGAAGTVLGVNCGTNGATEKEYCIQL